MARRKTRPQYIQKFVDSINDRLREYSIKDEYNDSLFTFGVDFLIHNGYYRGYNFFRDKEIEIHGEKKIARVLTGSAVDYDYLQLL